MENSPDATNVQPKSSNCSQPAEEHGRDSIMHRLIRANENDTVKRLLASGNEKVCLMDGPNCFMLAAKNPRVSSSKSRWKMVRTLLEHDSRGVKARDEGI
jgi:ankyrin repeat protein